MIDQKRLINKLENYKIALNENSLQLIDQFSDILLEWNQKINLTAIKDTEDIENKHIVDSILLAVQPEVQGNMVDVGSGAGFPGLITKIVKPNLNITLVEPIAKRANFLKTAADLLGIQITVLNERSEVLARGINRDYYDIATARAVAALPQLAEYCLPLVKENGWFIAMKGPDEAEREAAKSAIQKLSGSLNEIREFKLPDGSARSLIFIKKCAPTHHIYPRNTAKISKKPL